MSATLIKCDVSYEDEVLIETKGCGQSEDVWGECDDSKGEKKNLSVKVIAWG